MHSIFGRFWKIMSIESKALDRSRRMGVHCFASDFRSGSSSGLPNEIFARGWALPAILRYMRVWHWGRRLDFRKGSLSTDAESSTVLGRSWKYAWELEGRMAVRIWNLLFPSSKRLLITDWSLRTCDNPQYSLVTEPTAEQSRKYFNWHQHHWSRSTHKENKLLYLLLFITFINNRTYLHLQIEIN